MVGAALRCRMCRRAVVDVACLVAGADEGPSAGCSIWHIDAENLPEWIQTSVQQALWTAGKLNCRHCGARLGGFSFLGRHSCPCGRDASVHLSRSRVDLDQKRHAVLVVRPRRTSSGTGLCESEDEASLDCFRPTRLPALPPTVPAEDLDPLCPGGNVWHGAADHADTPGSESSVGRAAAAWSVLPGGSQSTLELQRTEGVSLGSEGEAELEDAADRGVPSSTARSRRDQNRVKSLRRKQRRRQRWLQSQRKEEAATQMNSDSPLDSEDVDRDGLTCAVCLDVLFSPHRCRPCAHVFCEPCLRTLAKNRAATTPCPLCRRVICCTSLHRELDQTARTLFPKVWTSRKQNFQNSPSSRWPLPSSQLPHFPWGHQRGAAAAWRFTPRPFDLRMPGLPPHTFSYIHIVVFIFALKFLCCLSILLYKLTF